MSSPSWTLVMGLNERLLSEARSQSHDVERRLLELEKAQQGWLRADAFDALEARIKEEEDE